VRQSSCRTGLTAATFPEGQAAGRDHLRTAFPDQFTLVTEFIKEGEGPSADAAAGARFTDLSHSHAAMLSRVEAECREWLG
jgi:hypothetical protein